MNISTLWKTGFVAFAMFYASCLVSDDASVITLSGSVEFVGVEGGCWRIVTPDSVHYEPTNLPEKFKTDGLPIEFKARPADAATFCMVGETIELLSIRVRPKEL